MGDYGLLGWVPSVVIALATHPSVPSPSRTRNHPAFSSRTVNLVPFFKTLIILESMLGP